ncbi:sensor domain-containing diguanylate cyclase [Sulfobacillus harzensis]|uniref:GGDEF domain-containing protein n=1 Tax=Sulfobacillus harzensis TaxID=2729629 RepID=A0A7Y0L091_9FIRM|nr:GGDEF domain-containing protein [Sulfobacillus harzensis]NMP20877.1 GGDEF domain-containing protein [Sulfobacillus harzensis]
MDPNSESVLRVFLHRSRQVIEKPTLKEKLTAIAQAIVEAGLFRRVAVQLYAESYGEKLFGWAGITAEEEQWLETHDTLGPDEYERVRRYGVDLGNLYFVPHDRIWMVLGDPDSFLLSSQVEWQGPGYWHPDDMLYAPLLASDNTTMGNVTADDPPDHRLPTEHTAALLTPFLAIASILVEQSLDRRRDTLTSCFNGPFFRDEMATLEASGNLRGVLFLDMDNLKMVNDSQGHAAGDRLIQDTAHGLGQIVQQVLGRSMPVFRLHGDEFAVLLRSGSPPLDRMLPELRTLRDAYLPNISIGGAEYQLGMSLAELTRLAEQSMYQDKWTRKGLWPQ